MKSTVFELRFPGNAPKRHESYTVKFHVPTLRAYAVEYSEFKFKGGLQEHKELVEGSDFELVEDGVLWHGFFEPTYVLEDRYRLIIHYHGIRDYQALFPGVENLRLRERLGAFYKEAEASLENEMWLSYALMCGALYEGLLYGHLGKDGQFSTLIKSAEERRLIDPKTVDVMNEARNMRNLVHASRWEQPYVSRAQAMDMRAIMDRLIKSASHWEIEKQTA